MRMLFSILLLAFSCQTMLGQTPMLSNHHGLISVRSGALLSVRGDVLNKQGGEILNSDTIAVTGDWINNGGNFCFINQNEGIVRLLGGNQRIRGNSITQFYDLRLENAGIKYGDLDVHVNGFLRLNQFEMAMQTNTVSVFNNQPVAVETGPSLFGFVSADNGGGIRWNTSPNTSYFFPVGASLIGRYFRPLILAPQGNSNNIKVRMAMTDASNEGFDRNLRQQILCEVNPSFYHQIIPAQPTLTLLRYYFDQTVDGHWEEQAHWQNTPRWEKWTPSFSGNDAIYQLDYLESSIPGFDFSSQAFALAKAIDSFDLIASHNPICEGDTVVVTAPGGYTNYQFFVNGTLAYNGPDSFFVAIEPNDGDVVTATVLNSDCIGYSNPLVIDVYQNNITLTSDRIAVCEYDTITFTGSAGFLNYNFFVNGNSVQSSQNPIFASDMLEDGDVVVVIGTDANCDYVSNPIAITIYHNQVTLVASDTTICEGTPIVFTATNGFLNYDFLVNGNVLQTGGNHVFTYTTFTDNDIVTVVATDSFCRYRSNSIGIFIYRHPIAISASPDTVCQYQSIAFTASTGFNTYEFFVNGTLVQQGNGSTYTANLNDGDLVYVRGIDDNCPFVSNTVRVNEYFNTVTLAANDLSICPYDTINFMASWGFNSYTFYHNGTTAQQGASPIFVLPTPQDGDSVWVVATDDHCDYTSTTSFIVVFNQPISLQVTPNPACIGQQVTVTATQGFSNYDFLVNGAIVQQGISNALTNTVLEDGDVVQVIGYNNGCRYPSQLVVSNRVVAELHLTIEDSTLCEGNPAVLIATPGFDNYVFYNQQGVISSQTTNELILLPISDGDRIRVEATLMGCPFVGIDTISITEYPAAIAIAYGDTTIYADGYANIGVTANGQITWTPTGSLSCSDCPILAASPNVSTAYTVSVITTDGCIALDTVWVLVREPLADSLIIPNTITPNGDGANDRWVIDGIQLLPNHEVVILNRWGDEVYRSRNYQNDFEGMYSGGELPAGTYYYIIRFGSVATYKGPLVILRE